MMRLFFFLLLTGTLHAQVTLTNSNLPILVITTDEEIPDEPKITGELGVVWNEDGSRNFLSQGFNHYDGQIGIEVRGSTSQFFPKKGYALETRNADGSNNNVELLGMPSENDWVLHGPFSDKTLLRNALAYQLAADVGRYAPRVRMVELVLNDDYRGVYLLTERIKRDGDRVDIKKLDPDDLDGDALTGGYILKIDKFTGAVADGFVSEYAPIPDSFQQTFFQFHYPKPEDIQPAQATYIENYVRDFEDALLSDDWLDPQDGYRRYLDVDAFIDFMWTQEITRNTDAYRLSTFFSKDRDSEGGKLTFGPVWDFNLAFANADYCLGSGYEGWAWDFNDFCPGDGWVIHFWWERLRADPVFWQQARDRWAELRQTVWSDDALLTRIDDLELRISEGAGRNFVRWPILNDWVWPNPVWLGTHAAEVDRVRDWLLDRAAWIDGQLLEPTSAAELITDVPLTVAPNPGRAFVFTFGAPVDGTLRVFDALGRVVFTHALAGDTHVHWHAVELPSGTYFYDFIGESGAARGRLVRR